MDVDCDAGVLAAEKAVLDDGDPGSHCEGLAFVDAAQFFRGGFHPVGGVRAIEGDGDVCMLGAAVPVGWGAVESLDRAPVALAPLPVGEGATHDGAYLGIGSEGDALEALVSLGYNERDAREALKRVPKETKGAGERVKAALKVLSQHA